MRSLTNLFSKPGTVFTLLFVFIGIGIGLYFGLPHTLPTSMELLEPIKKLTKPSDQLATPTTIRLDALATPSTTVDTLQFRWQPSARQTYLYKTNVYIKVDTGATLKAKSAWQEVSNHLSGVLNVRVFDRHKDRIRVGVQLSNVDFKLNNQDFPLLTTLLGTFFLVEMSMEGKPLQFNFPRYIDPSNQLFIKEIVNSVQVVLPSSTTQTSWKTEENHNTGDYQAAYQRSSKGDILKHKVKYSTVNLQQNDQKANQLKLTDKIEQSSFTAQVATQQSWLQSLKGEERIDFNMISGKLIEMSSQVELTLSKQPQDPNLGIWRAADDYDEVLSSFAEAKGDVSLSQNIIDQLESEKLREQFANTKISTLVNILMDKFGSNEKFDINELIPYMQEIEKYLTVYPDAALEIPTLLENENLSQKLATHLIGALEQAGTPQAQKALGIIATNDKPEGGQRAIQAITSFNFIEHPEPQTVNTLLDLAGSKNPERADTALLAMGSVLKNSMGVQRLQVREQLVQRLQTSAENRPILLKAIGNTGDEGLLPEIEPYVKDPQPYTRAAAMQAMRKFDDPTSLNYLIETATKDEHREVRGAALETLMQRQNNVPTIVKALREYLPQETETELRSKIISFLGKHKADDPQIVDTLREQLKKESNRYIIKDIYNAIYR